MSSPSSIPQDTSPTTEKPTVASATVVVSEDTAKKRKLGDNEETETEKRRCIEVDGEVGKKTSELSGTCNEVTGPSEGVRLKTEVTTYYKTKECENKEEWLLYKGIIESEESQLVDRYWLWKKWLNRKKVEEEKVVEKKLTVANGRETSIEAFLTRSLETHIKNSSASRQSIRIWLLHAPELLRRREIHDWYSQYTMIWSLLSSHELTPWWAIDMARECKSIEEVMDAVGETMPVGELAKGMMEEGLMSAEELVVKKEQFIRYWVNESNKKDGDFRLYDLRALLGHHPSFLPFIEAKSHLFVNVKRGARATISSFRKAIEEYTFFLLNNKPVDAKGGGTWVTNGTTLGKKEVDVKEQGQEVQRSGAFPSASGTYQSGFRRNFNGRGAFRGNGRYGRGGFKKAGVNGIATRWMGVMEVEGKSVSGVIDTGSSITVLPDYMSESLGVETAAVQRIEAKTANGSPLLLTEQSAKTVRVGFQGKDIFTKLYFSPEVDSVYIGWDVCAGVKNESAPRL